MIQENEIFARDMNDVAAEAEKLVIDSMVRFNDTLKMLFSHCR
jgi:hypothetical protein